jgi:hypothetical protein
MFNNVMLYPGNSVIEKINVGVIHLDPDAILARTWADEYLIEKQGNESGIDGRIISRFIQSGNPDAARKFIRLAQPSK